MEPGLDILTGIYAHILRQIPPKLSQDLTTGHRAFAVKIRHLSHSMGTCIGSSAAADLNFLPQDPGKGLLQLALDGVINPRQPLPATVTTAVIANIKPQIPQIPPTPLVLPVHYPQKTGSFPSNHTPEHDREHNA
jgi:hypothetical protein